MMWIISLKDKIFLATLVCFLIVLFITCLTFGQLEIYEAGYAKFIADADVIFMPAGVSKLIFDTTECVGCEDSLPAWRFIGDLKVDTIVRDGVKEALICDSQMKDIDIYSDSLISIMKRNNIFAIGRRFSKAIPHDTIVWDSIRQKHHTVPDLSRYYYIAFSEDKIIDSIVSELLSIPQLRDVDGLPKAIW